MSGLHVACAADSRYLPHAAAMIHSVARTLAPGRLTVHLLHGPALAPAETGTLAAAVRGWGAGFEAHRIEDREVAHLPVMGRIGREMWFRLFLPARLPALDRVLYLDCDTIACDSLEPLWWMDLQGRPLGAVSNVFERGKETHATALGLADARDYFNSGVLLMDLARWRADDLAGRALELAGASRLTWPDQDALNLALAGRWLALHPRWNCQNSLYHWRQAREVFGADAVASATRAPGIVHFEGGLMAKPWNYLCKHPLRAEYFRHRAATPWPEVVVEGRTAFARLLRPLPQSWAVAAIGLRRRLR